MLQTSDAMESVVQIVLPALTGGLTGIISAFVAMRIQRRARETELTEKIQIQYLNPLLIATKDFRERLENIDDRIKRGDSLLTNIIVELKNGTRSGLEYALWANGFGHFGLSTLYITTVYFACASKIRADLPFVKLSSGDDRTLLDLLGKIRESLGGEFGIWENLQDSFGSYVRRTDGVIMNYKEFCALLGDEASRPWFLRLIDFYRDLDRKLPEEREGMTAGLKALEVFLSEK